uniref:Uncharacterized protein n=1 Tax=Anguilla anguilla TaxID=7936 RepID=A0A0E9R5L5_ANGAN
MHTTTAQKQKRGLVYRIFYIFHSGIVSSRVRRDTKNGRSCCILFLPHSF